MSAMHVVYRRLGDGVWFCYTATRSFCVTARSVDSARAQVTGSIGTAAVDHLVEAVEHHELAIDESIYVRVALDASEAARSTLFHHIALARQNHVQRELSRIRQDTGEVIILACMPDDQVGWILDQLGDPDTALIATLVAGVLVWMLPITGSISPFADPVAPSVLSGGITRASTISDLIRARPDAGYALTV